MRDLLPGICHAVHGHDLRAALHNRPGAVRTECDSQVRVHDDLPRWWHRRRRQRLPGCLHDRGLQLVLDQLINLTDPDRRIHPTDEVQRYPRGSGPHCGRGRARRWWRRREPPSRRADRGQTRGDGGRARSLRVAGERATWSNLNATATNPTNSFAAGTVTIGSNFGTSSLSVTGADPGPRRCNPTAPPATASCSSATSSC